VGQRTALINDLRWHLHDIDPEFEVPARRFTQRNWQTRAADRLNALPARAQVRVALDELGRIHELTTAIDSLETEVHQLVRVYRPALLAWVGCGPLTAAQVIGETAGAERFATAAKFARISGTPPIPASSGNRVRHRLDPAATASSTPHCTASRSPRSAFIHPLRPISKRSSPRAKPTKKPSAASNDNSPAPCGDSYSPARRAHPSATSPTPPPSPKTRRRTPAAIHCNAPPTTPSTTPCSLVDDRGCWPGSEVKRSRTHERRCCPRPGMPIRSCDHGRLETSTQRTWILAAYPALSSC
jgi:hypothetical protein